MADQEKERLFIEYCMTGVYQSDEWKRVYCRAKKTKVKRQMTPAKEGELRKRERNESIWTEMKKRL